MSRHRRVTPAAYPQHVLNRGNEKATIFHKPADYEAFLSILADGMTRVAIRILAFCLMRNHFHLVLLPSTAYAIPAYMRWTMNVHVRRYRQHYRSNGTGHVYQDRYKNYVIQDETHLLTVLRYVEGNAARANLVERAEDWPWSSLNRTATGDGRTIVSAWPCPRPSNWADIVNEPFSIEALQRLRQSAERGVPYGSEEWVEETVRRYGLESTVRPPHRPAGGPQKLPEV
ncbi:MAG: transposase [Acidobacteria bacterium]|nr:transposase [Acidobacteriota bacterium]